MIAEMAAGLGALKTAGDIIQGLNATATEAKINEVKIGLQRSILEAQSALMAAQFAETAAAQRIRDLEQQIVGLKDWEGEKQRYEMKRFHPGTFAYSLKAGMEAGEVPHRICAGCYQKGEKGILQATGEMLFRDRVHICTSCQIKVALGSEEAER